MLDQLRQGAQGWVSKVLMALLVLSFAVWGIGGFEGYGAGTLATVGDTEVSIQEFANAYDQTQRAAQQTGQEANPQQVLSRLLLSAALDDEARGHGLGVSDDRVAREIAANPAFRGAGGAFDRERFALLLDNARIDRDDYVRDVKRDLVREQIMVSLGVGIEAPQPLVEALYRLQNEERAISFFPVDESAIEPVAPPDDGVLQDYFDANRERFRAPEYRKLALLILDPTAVADPAAVSEEELAAEYERRIANYTRPERRRIEQIRFGTAEAANEALAALRAGKDFSALAAEKGEAPANIDLGLKSKAEIIDPAVAEAAFAAAPNEPVAVTDGALEPSVIRVTEVEPGSVTPLAEVSARLREDLATRAAREHVHDLYDQVEDERAGGTTLEEAAAKLSLPYRVVENVAVDGSIADGRPMETIPNQAQVLEEAFESDVGVENSPVRAGGDAWVFYDVLEITPERDRTLDEVRADAVAAWTAEETANRIAAKAESLYERARAGEPFSALAAVIGQTVATVENVKRGTPQGGLSANAISQAFAGPQGHVANAEGDGYERIILKVDRVTAPAFFAEAADASAIRQRLNPSLENELIAIYNRQLLQSRDASVNSAAFQQLTGQIQTQ